MSAWLVNLIKQAQWPDEKMLQTWPATIIQQYNQLQKLAKEENLYGVMLQTKDLFEEIIKLPTVMALIVLDSFANSILDEKSIIVAQKFLSQPMTMGAWYSLAMHIVKSRKELNIPESLATILRKTTLLFQQPITNDISDIVNWRNNSIGHGALRFSESDSYKEELENIFYLLSEYVYGESRYSVNDLYGRISIKMDPSDDCLIIDGNFYSFGNFAAQTEAKTYLFESYYSTKKITKFQSETGSQYSRRMQYFDDLYHACFRQNMSTERIRADFVSRENEMLLEYLNNPETYIKPKYIVNKLQSIMDEIGKGIILIRMERGMGKTAFASKLDGLYTSRKECLIPEATARCYHVSNADLKGIEDYYNSFNNAFKHSYSHGEDIRESGVETVNIVRSRQTISEDMAVALKAYHEWYNREYTVFVIDGIDEISGNSEEILNTIPNSKQLTEGTFILLLSRFEDEKTVDKMAGRYIQRAVSMADRIIDIRRDMPENKSLMLQYVHSCVPSYSTDAAEKIIKKADYRMLFVKPYLVLPEETASVDNETDLIRLYYDRLAVFLNEKQKRALTRLSVILALLHIVSVEEMDQYLDCFDVSYQNIGLLNDLKPLLTVSHIQGRTYYSFASVAFEKYILETRYVDNLCEIIRDMVITIDQGTDEIRKHDKSIDSYVLSDFEQMDYCIESQNIFELRKTLYEKCFYYANAISIAYRFAKGNESLWKTISTETIVDDFVVFLGLFSFNYADLFGYGSGENDSNPYDFFYTLLKEYICGDAPIYIKQSINDYAKYLLTNLEQLLQKNEHYRGFFLSACGDNNGDRESLLKLIKNQVENGKDISEYFWILSFAWRDDDEELWKALKREGLLWEFVDYKISMEERRGGNPFPFDTDILEIVMTRYNVGDEREERIRNIWLKKELKEGVRFYSRGGRNQLEHRNKQAIIDAYKEIKNKDFVISPENQAMLMQIFPDIDAECNQSLDLRLSILCEKINMYMDHWDNDDEKCGEISDLIELLSHNPILDVIICDVDYTDTLSRLYDKAQDAGEKGNLPFFIKKAGLDGKITIIDFLKICCRTEVLESNGTIWGMWLKVLLDYDFAIINCPVYKYYYLLYKLQYDQVFSEDDPIWLRAIGFWVENNETIHFVNVSSDIYDVIEKNIHDVTGKTGFNDRIFCTNDTIKLVSIYLDKKDYYDKAISLMEKMKTDIPYILQKCENYSTVMNRRIKRNVFRYEHFVEQHHPELMQVLPLKVITEPTAGLMQDIIDHIETFHTFSELTETIIHIFDYYYEKELYTEAICLCDKSISELRIAKRKNEENSVEFQLAICLDGIRSLFRYISNENDNSILEHEFDDEIVQRNRVLPHSSSSSDDGLLASLFNYYAHEEQCLDPKDYRNDYLKSFFAGNGSLQIGPFNRTPPSWDNF